MVCGPDSSADQGVSLGDVARQHRHASASRPRVSLTEDDLTPSLPIPAVTVDGSMNDKEIVTAYRGFLQSHSRSDGEKMLRTWYDTEVERLNKFSGEAVMLSKLLETDQANDEPSGDAEDDGARDREHAERAALSALRSRQLIERDKSGMRRIGAALIRLRTIFDPTGKKFDWFDTNLNDPSSDEVSQ